MGYSSALYLNTTGLLMVGDASQPTSEIEFQYSKARTLLILVYHWYLWTRACYMGCLATTDVRKSTKARNQGGEGSHSLQATFWTDLSIVGFLQLHSDTCFLCRYGWLCLRLQTVIQL